MMSEMRGEMRRNPNGNGWQGHLVLGGRTLVLVGTLSEDEEGKFLQLDAQLFGSPYTEADLDRLTYARDHGPAVVGMPEQLSGRTRLPKDAIPTFTGRQGT